MDGPAQAGGTVRVFADGTITLGEAVALSQAEGLVEMKTYLLLACLNGELAGAYRDGHTWRIPYDEYQRWIEPVLTAVNAPPRPPPARPWWQYVPWHVVFWIVVGIVCWILAVHS